MSLGPLDCVAKRLQGYRGILFITGKRADEVFSKDKLLSNANAVFCCVVDVLGRNVLPVACLCQGRETSCPNANSCKGRKRETGQDALWASPELKNPGGQHDDVTMPAAALRCRSLWTSCSDAAPPPLPSLSASRGFCRLRRILHCNLTPLISDLSSHTHT